MTENEAAEFNSRIRLLKAELEDKNKQIEDIGKNKEKLEKLSEKAM